MSTPTISDFYTGSVAHPNSTPFRQAYTWYGDYSSPTEDTTPFVVTPDATETIYVWKFGIMCLGYWDEGPYPKCNHVIHMIAELDNLPANPISLYFDKPANVYGGYASNDMFIVSNVAIGTRLASYPNMFALEFKFSPPICLTGSTEHFRFQIEHETTHVINNTGLLYGLMSFSAQGWVLLTSDL